VGQERQLVGQTLTLDGKGYTVVGILPPGLKHPGLTLAGMPPAGADVWIPLIPGANEQDRSFANMRIVARLKPQVALTQAQAEMKVLAMQLEQQYPDMNSNLGIGVVSLHEHLTGRVRRALWILLGAVGCVLLIACANVANLLLARAAGRQTEMAVRMALGANRWRLIRQLLVECIALSVTGGVCGLLLAASGVPMLIGLSATGIPRADEIGISLPVLGFTLLVSLLTGVAFGLAPALQSSRIHLVEALKEGKKGAAGGARQPYLLSALVVIEIALALTLLVGAGLMIRSFRSVSAVEPGFDPHNLLTIAIPLQQASYKDQQLQLRYYERALPALNALPGVQSAAGAFRIPITGFATAIFTVQGQPVPVGQEPNADYRTVSQDYFRTMRIAVTRGRGFSERDHAEAPDAVIINEELAQRFFPNEDPMGKRLQIALEKTRWREIVGVVASAKLSGLEASADPAIYVPFQQNTWPNALRTSFLVVRTDGDPNYYRAAIRETLRSVDPALPITQLRTMDEIIADSLSQRRFNMALLLIFAVVAALLAAVGVYGVMSYLVTQRTHELGVRMALGAQRGDILKLVAGGGAKLAAIGIAIGVTLALAMTRLMSGLLFGVSATDPWTFVFIATLFAVVALLASYLPARRAAGTDPLVALRHD
jgi:putative ABC transport system permease protein